jgi:hypothetical protein
MACCWITSWLQAKLNATGIAALEREFDHGSASAALQRLRRVLRNASHVLAAQPEQAARAPPLTASLLASEALLRTLTGD